MTEVKTIVCLANSRKLSGRCVAGIDLGGHGWGEWIRPVSSRPKYEVSEVERQYEDGSDPRVLDIVSIPLLEPRPHRYQKENWLLDPNYYWGNEGRAGWDVLLASEDRRPFVWINGDSSRNGENDRVPEQQAGNLADSLKLIRPSGLTLHVHEEHGKRVVRASFQYGRSSYALRVTDPIYERKYLAKPDGIYKLGEAFLTVSLGEPFGRYVYKLVAAIIEQAHAEGGSTR